MALTRAQEYAGHWLDRKVRYSLRLAEQQGIERRTLDALVAAGRARLIDGVNPIYESTATGPGGQRHRAGEARDPRSSRLEQPVEENLRVLDAQEERVARWLDRVGRVTLRLARQQGVDRALLDALVRFGRARRIEGEDELVYETTLDPGVTPDTAPAPVPLEPTQAPVRMNPDVQLTARQERAARWLMRAGSCSLRQADERGITPELEAVVAAGRAERYVAGEGAEPIFRHHATGPWRDVPAVPGPSQPPPPPPTAPAVERIRELLTDGVPRTPAEVAGALLQGSTNFIEAREISREVQRVLPMLASRGFFHRLMLGVQMQSGHPPRYEEKYVDATTVLPVCPTCFRNYWGAEAVPPQSSGHPIALCSVCRQRANDPSFVSKSEVEDVREARAEK